MRDDGTSATNLAFGVIDRLSVHDFVSASREGGDVGGESQPFPFICFVIRVFFDRGLCEGQFGAKVLNRVEAWAECFPCFSPEGG